MWKQFCDGAPPQLPHPQAQTSMRETAKAWSSASFLEALEIRHRFEGNSQYKGGS